MAAIATELPLPGSPWGRARETVCIRLPRTPPRVAAPLKRVDYLRYHENWACGVRGARRRLPPRGTMKTRAITACLVLAAAISGVAVAGQEAPAPNLITITVVVTDAKTEKPVNQAHLTLVFREKLGKAIRFKTLSYSAKTDAQGRGRFVYIPEGTVQLMVTNEGYQAFGREFEVSKDHATLEVKLKPPQPLL
jgi:hypothetical protein